MIKGLLRLRRQQGVTRRGIEKIVVGRTVRPIGNRAPMSVFFPDDAAVSAIDVPLVRSPTLPASHRTVGMERKKIKAFESMVPAAHKRCRR